MFKGKNLFPISNVIPTATGYYMDAQGEVWSERAKRGILTKLDGSTTPSGRYVTLQTNNQTSHSYRHDQLVHLCRGHWQWKALTATDTVKVAKTDLATAMGLKPAALPSVKQMAVSAVANHQTTQVAIGTRHHAPSVAAGIKARGWVIGKIHQGALSLGLEPKIHTVETSVDAEIDRLAKQYVGQKFVKLQIQGAVTAGAVVWE
jgi:hypothetical protein